MHAIVSIHDVMPHHLDRVQELLARMSHLEPRHITLLVVPGLDWTDARLDRLKTFADSGYRLAGHGWFHEARIIRTPYHYLHSLFISRRAAEHLSLDSNEIKALITHCYQWFADRKLPMPDLYVPPAWAMGNISKAELCTTPFRYFETTAGLLDSATGRQTRLPLTGFEADTRFRALFLTCWNGINHRLGSPQRPVRLSIHPDDLYLLLGKSLARYLERVTFAVPYASVL